MVAKRLKSLTIALRLKNRQHASDLIVSSKAFMQPYPRFVWLALGGMV
jgi:hypothetical protein